MSRCVTGSAAVLEWHPVEPPIGPVYTCADCTHARAHALEFNSDNHYAVSLVPHSLSVCPSAILSFLSVYLSIRLPVVPNQREQCIYLSLWFLPQRVSTRDKFSHLSFHATKQADISLSRTEPTHMTWWYGASRHLLGTLHELLYGFFFKPIAYNCVSDPVVHSMLLLICTLMCTSSPSHLPFTLPPALPWRSILLPSVIT